MTGREALYEGKAKIIYTGPEDGTLVSFQGRCHPSTPRRKMYHRQGRAEQLIISEHIMERLPAGWTTHFIERLNERDS